MIKITLPEKPVDRYRIDWYEISVSPDWYYITKRHAIYYANVKYTILYPTEKNGADLIDQWMFYKDDYASGRRDGWDLTGIGWDDCFATENEAKAEVIKRLNKYLNRVNKHSAMIAQMILEVTAK